jgi:hypothetical protein
MPITLRLDFLSIESCTTKLTNRKKLAYVYEFISLAAPDSARKQNKSAFGEAENTRENPVCRARCSRPLPTAPVNIPLEHGVAHMRIQISR